MGRFAEMVISAGEVCADGLDERIRAAALLIFLYDRDDVLCGVAAVKQPDAAYRNGVFAKAEASFDPATYALELGWVVVAEKYRGHGLNRIAYFVTDPAQIAFRGKKPAGDYKI